VLTAIGPVNKHFHWIVAVTIMFNFWALFLMIF